MNDLNFSERPSADYCTKMSIENLLSDSDSTATDTKLVILSGLMSAIENKHDKINECSSFHQLFQKGEWRANLFNLLKSCLTVEKNRYVIFTARKVLTCLVKNFNSQEGVKVIQQIFDTNDHLEQIHTGLQICKVLFSKKNANHEDMVCPLGHLVTRAWQTLTTTIRDDNIYNHCLLDLFSVCIKLAKTVLTKTVTNEPALILKAILGNGEDFNQILFDKSIKTYVKTKLMNFLYVIMRQSDITNITMLSDEIFSISVSLFNKLLSCDMSSVLKKSGRTTFIGNSLDVTDGLTCDIGHIRDWTFLCFCLSSCLIHQEDFKDQVEIFLTRTDDCVTQLLDENKLSVTPWLPDINISFLWLPDIYGDQDDKWIDAMILLMEIYSLERKQSSLYTEQFLDQHHLHILQFVRTLGYDHLVLIDLLTSPETNCLAYLMKYLKYLLLTWNDFITIISQIQFAQNAELADSKDEYYNANENADVANLGQYDMTSLQYRLSKDGEELHENVKDDVTEVKLDNVVKANELCVNHQKGGDESPEIGSDKRSNDQLLASSSLLLIADAYDDVDVDDSDDSDNENRIMDTFDKNKCSNIHEAEIKVSMQKKEFDEFHSTKTVLHLTKSPSQVNAGKVSPPEDTIIQQEEKISNGCEENNVLEFGSTESGAEIDNVSLVSSITEEDNEHNLDVGKGCIADDSHDILDKVIGMIIRTRLQLEKLSDSSLMKYNPQVLVNLIESVEELYEKN